MTLTSGEKADQGTENFVVKKASEPQCCDHMKNKDGGKVLGIRLVWRAQGILGAWVENHVAH